MSVHWMPVLEFDGKHPEFVRGYEAGSVCATLRARPDEEIAETVHMDNTEMMLRIAARTHRQVRSRDLDDTWMEVTFSPAEDH
jgi:hypothetical protein